MMSSVAMWVSLRASDNDVSLVLFVDDVSLVSLLMLLLLLFVDDVSLMSSSNRDIDD